MIYFLIKSKEKKTLGYNMKMEVFSLTEEKAKYEQNQHEKPLSFMAMVIITGFVGGILWSGLAFFAYFFNFTEIHPRVILEPWAIGAWKKQWLGTVISIVLIGAISIVVAIVYYIALRKFKSILIGMGFGLALLVLVLFVLNPIFPGIPPFREIDRNTLITTACFYILYGTFIGYSISYEEHEMKKIKRENGENEFSTE